MAVRLEKLSSVCFAEARAQRVFACNERAELIVRGLERFEARSFLVVADGSRVGAVAKGLAGRGRRAVQVAGLALADEHQRAEAGDLNPKDGVSSKESEEDGGDSPVPWMSEEEPKAVVSEVVLKEDDLRVIEYAGNEEVQPDDAHPLNSLADALLNKINGDERGFSLTDVGGLWKTGEEAGELKVPEICLSGFDVKEGVSPLAQWTSTELTMQHTQLARIVTDVFYMQIAFAFFGGVRVVEALLNVYSTSPPDFGKFKELLNALDPFTISWLANNVREPLSSLTEADPMDLEKVVKLKSSVWQAVHAFYERQWKVMATLAMARSLSLIASHEPTTKAVTDKVQWLWNALMALPVF